MVRSGGGKREPDGVVVLVIAARNAEGGKGFDLGDSHAEERGTRKDMTGTARSNHPGGAMPVANVRYLLKRLWTWQWCHISSARDVKGLGEFS